MTLQHGPMLTKKENVLLIVPMMLSKKLLHMMILECVYKIAPIPISESLVMMIFHAVLKNAYQPPSYLVILIIIDVNNNAHHLISVIQSADNVSINAHKTISPKLYQYQM